MAKKRIRKDLLLYGANDLDAFSSEYQIDKTTNKQKYIGNIETYLNNLGSVHQDTSNTSCFKSSISNLEELNAKFTKLQNDVNTLSKKMRETAKAYIDADQNNYDSMNKSAMALVASGISAATAKKNLNDFLADILKKGNEKDAKALAAFLAELKKTNADIFTDVKSKLSGTKKGKKFIKEYLNTATKTTKKASSKVSTYHPKKYKTRTAWKKSLTTYYKTKYKLTDANAEKLAGQQMSQIEKLNKGKISATEYNRVLNSRVKEMQTAQATQQSLAESISADKGSKTDSIEQIKQNNEAGTTKNAESIEEALQVETKTVETPAPEPASETTQVDSEGNTTVNTEQVGPAVATATEVATPAIVNKADEMLPEEPPQQNNQNFQEDVSAAQQEAMNTPTLENQVDESAESTAAITDNSSLSGTTTDPNLDSDLDKLDTADSTSDIIDGEKKKSSTHTTIDSSDTLESGSTTKKSSGSSPVVPVVAGVAAAGAAGVGAKVILDRRVNTSNDGNIGSENWSDDSYESSYSDTNSNDYYDTNSYEARNNNLIEEESNSVNNYDYKANSLKDMSIEEKEKQDMEKGEISFHDNIAYDAISDAELEATH